MSCGVGGAGSAVRDLCQQGALMCFWEIWSLCGKPNNAQCYLKPLSAFSLPKNS